MDEVKDGLIQKGTIQWDWSLDPASVCTPCCLPKTWIAKFKVNTPFCIDSNQYPIIEGFGDLDVDYEVKIPRKNFCWNKSN